MTAPKPNRVTTVQIPGEARKPEAEQAPPAPESLKSPEPDPVDMDALRERIREEERAIIHAELGAHGKALTQSYLRSTAPSKSDYANMRAADIDHTTLTAPVLTKDGYLCPPAPEAKK